MPDIYTTTADPLRPMVCSNCGGHFAGSNKNLTEARTHNEETVVVAICDVCRRGTHA